MIKTILFDLGGVIYTGDVDRAMSRFRDIGLQDVEKRLNAYTQTGIFGKLEDGSMSDTDFLGTLSTLCHRDISWQECQHCWLGYCKELPERNIAFLERLRHEGYRLVLASNTNPFVMEWMESGRFDSRGNGIGHYIDHLYVSYKLRHLKPAPDFFLSILEQENIAPAEALFIDDSPGNVASAAKLGINTLLAENGADWTQAMLNELEQLK